MDDDEVQEESKPENAVQEYFRKSSNTPRSEAASPVLSPISPTLNSERRSSLTSSPRRRNVLSPQPSSSANTSRSAGASPESSSGRRGSSGGGSSNAASSSTHANSTQSAQNAHHISLTRFAAAQAKKRHTAVRHDPNAVIQASPQEQLLPGQLRRYSDSYMDFRPAAARAGLYPQHTHEPLHLPHESALKSLRHYLKTKLKFFWVGHSRYAKIHFATYIVLGVIASVVIWGVEHNNNSTYLTISMLTGTGLNTTDFTKLHLFTKIFALILCFGGSPLTVILPITLVVRRHCTGPKPKVALMRLFAITLVYYSAFIVIPFLVYSFYLLAHTDKLDGINPFWFGIFHSISSFTNAGISLFPDGLMRFSTDYLISLLTAFQIIFGYMAIPIALRVCIWVSTFIPCTDKRPSLMLLSTPAFAGYLFPRVETQIIALVNVLIIIVGTISNVAFEWNQSLNHFSPHNKFLVAFFNDVTTRNAGLNTIDFSTNYEVTNLIAIYWMYIVGYPVGVRITRSLQPQILGEMVGFYVKKFLVSGKWWIAMSLLVILFAERHKLQEDPNFTFFKVLFEIISAYGTVGLSLGYPGKPYSFCGTWTTTSQVTLIFVMFIGRHRKLKGTLLNSIYEANTIGNPFPPPAPPDEDENV